MKQSSCYLGEGLVNIYRNWDQDSDQYPFLTRSLKDEVDSLLDRQDLGERDFLQPYFIVLAKDPITPWKRGEEMRSIPVCAYQFSGMEFLIGLDQAYSIFDMDYHDHIIGGEYPE